MRPRILSPGWWATIVLSLAGLWLLVAPTWVGFQPIGAHWVAATRNDVMVGGVLLAAGVLGLFAQVAFGLRDLAEHAARLAEPDASEHMTH